MEILKFKTTVKCSGCLAKVTPVLNDTVGEDNWDLDLQTTDKVLSIASDEHVSHESVVKAIEGAGYKAEKLS